MWKNKFFFCFHEELETVFIILRFSPLQTTKNKDKIIIVKFWAHKVCSKADVQNNFETNCLGKSLITSLTMKNKELLQSFVFLQKTCPIVEFRAKMKETLSKKSPRLGARKIIERVPAKRRFLFWPSKRGENRRKFLFVCVVLHWNWLS